MTTLAHRITATLLAARSSSSSSSSQMAMAAPARRSLRIRDDHHRRPAPPMAGSSCSSSSTGGSESGWKEDAATGLVVIVGATGTGKTKLSIDVARAVGGEVVNADKIQLYAGLDVTTNKVAHADRRGVPHHLLGAIRPDAGALSPSSFRSLAAATCGSVAARGRVPVVAGGSNSLIHALLAADHHLFDAFDPFAADRSSSYRPALRVPCCLLWVDVEERLLDEYLDRRVDDMVRGGMVEELREYFAATTPTERAAHAAGLGKAIGVPELGGYFAGRKTLRAAVDEIKANTRVLAAAQASKIRRMGEAWGWPVRRLDASATVRARLAGAGHAAEAASWERDVRGPGLAAVSAFLAADEAAPLGDDAISSASARVDEASTPPLLMRLPRMQCCDMVV